MEPDRPHILEHQAFGRGAYVCAGAPLALVEVRVIVGKFLALIVSTARDEGHHGLHGAHTLEHEPSFVWRLFELHLQLAPAGKSS